MGEFVGREEEFYLDQLSACECHISEEIDDDYEKKQQILFENIAKQQLIQEAELWQTMK